MFSGPCLGFIGIRISSVPSSDSHGVTMVMLLRIIVIIASITMASRGEYGSDRIKYSRHELFELSRSVASKSWPNQQAISRIKDFDILKPFRGHRGGKAISDHSRNIPVQLGHRPLNTCRSPRRLYESQSNLTQLNRDQLYYNAKHELTLAVMNVRSMANKLDEIVTCCIDEDVDIAAITETWLSSNSVDANIAIKNMVGYRFLGVNRENRRGGGVGLLFRDNIKVEQKQSGQLNSFEYGVWSVMMNNTNITIVNIYRPPYSSSHPVSCTVFLNEFSDFLGNIFMDYSDVIILGDFNIHWNVNDDRYNVQFRNLLTSLNLVQHVNCATHESGNTLDLILTREEFKYDLSDPQNVFPISDHGIIKCLLDISKPCVIKKEITFRRLRNIDQTAFGIDLEQFVEPLLNVDTTLDTLVHRYNDGLESLLDSHAPLVTKRVTCRTRPDWVTDGLLEMKKSVRKTEKKWRRNKNEANKIALYRVRYEFRKLVRKLKWDHINNSIRECGNDTKKLYGVINGLIGKTGNNPLPDTDEGNAALANRFASHFLGKVSEIRNDLDETEFFVPPVRQCNEMHHFEPLVEEEVKKLILRTKSTNCKADPIPASILKEHMTTIVPLLMKIINASLTSGDFAQDWKTSIVRPLLKKQGLPLELNNYRPVNNLPFLSKVVERGMLSQLNAHLKGESLLPDYIGGYREFHSCETSLLKLTNDILLNMDQQKVSPMIALDLSAAFDTVDHSVLLNVIQNCFGIKATALRWYQKYLINRKLTVQVDQDFSEEFDLPFSVPQGSCAGPVLFNMYVSTLLDHVKRNMPDDQVTLIAYADDHSCYNSFQAGDELDEQRSIGSLETCSEIICDWMRSNRLKMNGSKTEFVKFGNSVQTKKCVTTGININEEYIQESTCIKYLGVWLDSNLTFKVHVTEKCKQAMYTLYRIRVIRDHLSRDCLRQLVQSLVISQLDYCCSLLHGLPNSTLTRLQNVQNYAAKLILRRSKYDSNVACLKELHWLPIRFRILFRILCISFKCIHGKAPAELVSYFSISAPPRYGLRSGDSATRFTVPRTNCLTFGDRAFSVVGPREWNNLPDEVKSSLNYNTFKRNLKTHLFTLAFAG